MGQSDQRLLTATENVCRQSRLNSIIDPRTKQCTELLPTQPLTGIKLHMLVKLNIYLLYWYFQQNQWLNIIKHFIHNIHRLEWSP